TAKSEPVGKLAESAAHKALSGANLAEDAAIKSELTTLAQTTGENVVLGRVQTVKAPAGGIAGAYLYSVGGKGKIAVLLALSGANAADVVTPLGMHIAAARPVAL